MRRRAVSVICVVLLGAIFYSVGNRLFYENRWLQPPFDTPPYDRHIDEYVWYRLTYHYHLLFHQGALFDPHWNLGISSIGSTNLPTFIYGMWFDISGVDINTSYEMTEKWWTYLMAGAPRTDEEFKDYLKANLYFSDRTLLSGRECSALLSYVAFIVFVLHMVRIANLPSAVIYGYGLGQLNLFYTTRMMADSQLLCFLAASLYFFDCVVTAVSQRTKWAWTVVYSIVAGLTMGVKLTGFVVLTFLPVYMAVNWGIRRRSGGGGAEHWKLLVVHLCIAISVFVMCHPQAYRNCVGWVTDAFALQINGLRAEGKGVTFQTVADEFAHQIRAIAGERPASRIALALCVALGLMAFVTGDGDRARAMRWAPMVTCVMVFPLTLSYEWDERYTWCLTVVLCAMAVSGLNLIWRRLKAFVGRTTGYRKDGCDELAG